MYTRLTLFNRFPARAGDSLTDFGGRCYARRRFIHGGRLKIKDCAYRSPSVENGNSFARYIHDSSGMAAKTSLINEEWIFRGGPSLGLTMPSDEISSAHTDLACKFIFTRIFRVRRDAMAIRAASLRRARDRKLTAARVARRMNINTPG